MGLMLPSRRHRWASVGLAWLLSLQAAGFALQPIAAAASCCCARSTEHCRCAACSHARELSQPQSSARSCGEPGSPAESPAPRPFLAARLPHAPAAVSSPTPLQTPPPLPGRGPPEVPTPPPLA